MYYPQYFKGLSKSEIRKEIEKEGFSPHIISNGPGDIYHKHSHPETKLLVFLNGTMIVTVEDKKYNCTVGDKLIIPGNTVHSAEVGEDGCTFFWAENIL